VLLSLTSCFSIYRADITNAVKLEDVGHHPSNEKENGPKLHLERGQPSLPSSNIMRVFLLYAKRGGNRPKLVPCGTDSTGKKGGI